MSKKVKRLFEQFQPEHYELTLDVDPVEMVFSGKVKVNGKKVGRPSQRLTFHQKGLKVSSAKVIKHDKKSGDQEIKVSRVNLHKSYDEVRLHSDEMIYPGSYTVELTFSGKITDAMNGIYPCYFEENGKKKKLIATQFESHHAREAFPCVDEPEAKATFDLILLTPRNQTVIANTPVKKSKVNDKKLTTVFETTPKMSTYLLAFVCGDLGFTEATTKAGVKVRSYATPQNVKLTKFSVEVAAKCLDFFESYFGVNYPLKKLDLAALPDFSSGAMENWGLLTFREVAMLIDEKSSGVESRQMVALVICHEVSHQWFGDLVTMKWWDDLWLNESFANLMEYVAVDALFSEWKIKEQFTAHETLGALRRDSLKGVQPVHVDVRHPDEISTLFDPSIVYAKGGSLLNMLYNFIGEDKFRQGLKLYFDKHAYGNTEADDLWQELTAVSKVNVGELMANWLTKPGYPLVEVNFEPDTKKVNLKQKRFLSEREAKDDEQTVWQVPLAANLELSKKLMAKPEEKLTVNKSGTLLINHNGASYCLPKYVNNEHLKQIKVNLPEFSNLDRLLLIDGYNLLQRGGESKATELLELLESYQNEENENVWGTLALSLAEIRKLIEDDEKARQKLNKLIEKLTKNLVNKLGWQGKVDEPAAAKRLRNLILSLAVGAEVNSAITEAKKRFANFKKPSDLNPDIRGAVYFAGVRFGEDQDFEKLLTLHNSVQSAEEREELAAALTSAKDEKQIKQLLTLLTSENIRKQDVMHWFAWLIRSRYSRELTWNWLTENWSWVEASFESDKSYGFFARYAASAFSHKNELTKFSNFFEPKRQIVALTREIELAQAEIASRVTWRAANEAEVKTWLLTS